MAFRGVPTTRNITSFENGPTTWSTPCRRRRCATATRVHSISSPYANDSAAQCDGDTIWFTVEREEAFGLSAGSAASPLDEWRTCLIVDSSLGGRTGELRLRSNWDFYTRRTEATRDDADGDVVVVTDELALTALLERDFPGSSVWPGAESMVSWHGIWDVTILSAVASLTRRRSGYHVIASVAPASAYRGHGLARRVTRGVVGCARGVPWVALDVAHSNHVAQRVYRDTGFTERARFSRYGLPEG